MQSLAGQTTTAPASENEYTAWANKYLDTFNEAHAPHATREVNGKIVKGTYTHDCAKCIVKGVRFMGSDESAKAFIEDVRAQNGLEYINSVIKNFALAMGDSDFVKELSA